MVELNNFAYELFITDSTGSCAGSHLELNVFKANDDVLFDIAHNLKQSLRNVDDTLSLFEDLKKGVKHE